MPEEPTARLDFECPRCGYAVNSATVTSRDGDEIQPKPGDIGLCLKCAAPLQYAANLSPRWLTAEEVGSLPREAFAQIVRAMLAIVTHRPPP